MMDPKRSHAKFLHGVVELDEHYIGGTPKPKPGVVHRRSKGTSKQCVPIAVERHGPVRAAPVDNEKSVTLQPIIDQFIDKDAHLMSDKHWSYIHIGHQFLAPSHLNHALREYSRGSVHCNTGESYSSLFERGRVGVFHYFSRKHLLRYLNEFGFRWEHRVPVEKRTKFGKKKIQLKPIPIIDMILWLIIWRSGAHL